MTYARCPLAYKYTALFGLELLVETGIEPLNTDPMVDYLSASLEKMQIEPMVHAGRWVTGTGSRRWK